MIPNLSPFVVLVLLLVPTSICAQSTASIEGVITDQQRALIAGAEITAHDRATGLTRVAMTDDSGRYQIVALPVGDYRIELRARGFQTRILENLGIPDPYAAKPRAITR